jgi:hypothetical protein
MGAGHRPVFPAYGIASMRTALHRAFPGQFYLKPIGLIEGDVDPLTRDEVEIAQELGPIFVCGILSEIAIQYGRISVVPFITPKRVPNTFPSKVGTNPAAILRWLDASMTTTYGKGPGRRAAPLASILAGQYLRAGKNKGGGRVDNWQRIVLSVMKERANLNYKGAARIWALVERRDPMCDKDRDVVEAFRYVDRSDRKRQFPR